MPAIVALGGGTGSPNLLAGLKRMGHAVTMVVTVADDGDSSGVIRKALDMPSPGDIRNCLVALSDGPEGLAQLMQFRFEEMEFKGHAFGNIFLAALTKQLGDFDRAVKRMHDFLQVKGRVIPMAAEKVALVAEHADGTKSTGEQQISGSYKPIMGVTMRPSEVEAPREVIESIHDADLVILGPGSLYTSVIPNLLVGGVVDALSQSPAKIVYVCNLMTQPGETSDFTVSDHLMAILGHSKPDLIDAVIVNSEAMPEAQARRYREDGAVPVRLDRDKIPCEIFTCDMLEVGEVLRHHPDKLAHAVMDVYQGTPCSVDAA